jgi:hypothetical protein
LSSVAFCHVFKTFDKADVINRQLNVTWGGVASPLGLGLRIQVLDGAYDRTNSTEFPTFNSPFGFINPLKGGGQLHEILVATNPFNQTDSLTMTLAGSTEDQVTISMTLRDGSTSNNVTMDIYQVIIDLIGEWSFGSGATYTSEVNSTDGLDRGFVNADFTNLQDFIAPVITILANNPETILKDSNYIDAGATALDDQDGDITGNIITINNVDSSIVAVYQVSYNVTDNGNNNAFEVRTVNVVEQMPVSAGGGGSGRASPSLSGAGGIETDVSKLSDVPPLVQPIPIAPPSEVDRAFSLFDSLNSFFDPVTQEDSPVVPSPPPVQPETAPTQEPDSFVDRIANFFSGLFGFLYGVPNVYGEMNVTERMEDYEMTQINATRWMHKLGLPPHIQDDQGDWVANIFTEDANGIELESASMTYYFDKNSCLMSIYDTGRMIPSDIPLIAEDNWYVRVAPNGTESWSDMAINYLACSYSVTNSTNSIIINATKSDSLGTFSEIYTHSKYGGLKHTLYYTNENPAWTNHKFGFINFLYDIPVSFQLMNVNPANQVIVDSYSTFPSLQQPIEFGGVGIELTSLTSINYDRSNLFRIENTTDPNWNGTDPNIQVTEGLDLIHKISDTESRHFYYEFDTAFDQLDSFVFDVNTDNRVDLTIDYTNIFTPTGIGQTTSIDPTLESFSSFDVQRLATAFPPVSQGCHNSLPDSSALSTVFSVGLFGSLGSVPPTPEACHIPTMRFDITSIPDDAVPSNMTLAVNNTSGSFSVSSINGFPVNQASRWVHVTEDLNGLSKQSIFSSLLGVGHDVSGSGDFFTGGYTTGFVVLDTNIRLAPDSVLDRFELWLETGSNFYQLANCPEFSGTNGCTLITAGGFLGTGGSSTGFFDKTNSFLDITFDVFTVASEPLNLTDAYTPTPDTCFLDWDNPADNGGRVITSYDIERSINLGSFIFLANTGVATPTEFSDTTIISNESYRYRVSAINQEGTGAFAESTSCGIPSIADPPTLTNVFEEPLTDLTLDWVLGYDGGLDVLGYKIERSINGVLFTTLIADTGNTNTQFIDGTANVAVVNTYRVSTINSLGTSTPSNELGNVIPSSGGGGGASEGSPVGDPEPEPTQEDFDQALADAIAQLQPQTLTVVETIISNVFEFAVIDNTHEDLVLNSFLDDERLGIRWSSGQDIIIVSAVPSPSPFLITFEALPAIKQGSGAVVSTDFLLYNLQVPRLECGNQITQNCVQKVRYEIPVIVTAMIANKTVIDTGNITVDLVDDLIDPILVLLLATFGIPLVAGLVQRSRGKKNQTQSIRQVLNT